MEHLHRKHLSQLHTHRRRVRGAVAGMTNRRGIALIMVMAMTLALAALAVSAIYLSASGGILTRYYDRERDFKYAAEEALALGKSRVNTDTLLALPEDTAKMLVNNGTMADAYGTTIPRIRVNLYGAFTGDTVGRFGNFVTLLSTSFDSNGTRTVRRLDLAAESFSRFAMFVNTFSSSLAYGNGEFIRGRAHSNQGWYSSGSPGPIYFDTVSAVTTINGSSGALGPPPQYAYPPMAGHAAIPFPTVAKLAILPTYAAMGNLQFTPVTGAGVAVNHTVNATPVDISGRTTAPNTPGISAPYRGTRLRFKTVDFDGSGTVEEREGMMMIFDANLGIDTSAIRADLIHTGNIPNTSITIMNQCGLMVTIGGRNEFFPVARFRELWVRARVKGAVTAVGATAFTAADTNAMGGVQTTLDSLPSTAAITKIMSFGIGNSMCFPIGSPYLMLAERYVLAGNNCAQSVDTTQNAYAWGANAAAMGTPCAAAKQYGGQDSTFTAVVTRCALYGKGGYCKGGHQASLGAWRAWPGAALPAAPASTQAAEVPYLWPLFKPYNLPSKGVIQATTAVYLGGWDDRLRGNITLYMSDTTKNVVFVDDLQYDQDPTVLTARCRNFLGIIAGNNVVIADNAMNRPRPDAGGTIRMYGTPHFTLHAVTMSLKGTVGVEDGFNYPTWSPAGPQLSAAGGGPIQCGAGNNTSGGCINQTGGVIEQVISPTFSGTVGMRENRTVDPCQLTNRKPPFFPSTGRYVDNKYYEIDPVNVDTWAQVKAFYARLRG